MMGYLETGMRVLDSASALLARMQELAVLGANDTNTTADHEAINLEAEAIADEFNRLMTTSTYKGRDVFVDTASSFMFPWVVVIRDDLWYWSNRLLNFILRDYTNNSGGHFYE